MERVVGNGGPQRDTDGGMGPASASYGAPADLISGMGPRSRAYGTPGRCGASVIGSGLWNTASTLFPWRSFTNAP